MSLNKIIGNTVITINSFEFIYGSEFYTASYTDSPAGAFAPARKGWSIIRRKVGTASIPPCMEILTGEGWKGVLVSDRAPIVLYPTAEEVVKRSWEDIEGC